MASMVARRLIDVDEAWKSLRCFVEPLLGGNSAAPTPDEWLRSYNTVFAVCTSHTAEEGPRVLYLRLRELLVEHLAQQRLQLQEWRAKGQNLLSAYITRFQAFTSALDTFSEAFKYVDR